MFSLTSQHHSIWIFCIHKEMTIATGQKEAKKSPLRFLSFLLFHVPPPECPRFRTELGQTSRDRHPSRRRVGVEMFSLERIK